MQEGHCDLLALVLSGQNQTVGEVLDVVAGSCDVRIQVLVDAAFTVGSDIVGVCSGDCGQTGASSVSCNQLFVQVLQGADVLSLNGDQILRVVEAVDDLSNQSGVLIFQGVPPDDFDGLGDFVERSINSGCFSCGSLSASGTTGGAAGASSQGHNHDQCQQQSDKLFHVTLSFPF